MTATLHRILMTLGAIAAGVGGVFALPDVAPLGIPTQAGAITSMIAALCIVIATALRANFPTVAQDTPKENDK